MKNILLSFLLFPLCASAQLIDADVWLDKAVATMKNDAPLQMDYSYTVFDDENIVVLQDKGIMRLDGNRYALVMDKMGVWCDGESQWSYMLDIDEIYITDASSDEAQNLSPLFIMEKFRSGCSKEVVLQDGVAIITLHTPAGSEMEKVVLYIDADEYRLKAMTVSMPEQGYVKIILDKYQIKCNFALDEYKCPVEKFSTAEIVDMR